MKNSFIDPEAINIELQAIEDLGTNIVRNVSLLEQKVTYIIAKIKYCKTIKKADEYFALLDAIHYTLCDIFFKKNIGVPNKLENFIHDFDNLEQDKQYLYEKIKSGKYSLKKSIVLEGS